jgi:hypothetical protein
MKSLHPLLLHLSSLQLVMMMTGILQFKLLHQDKGSICPVHQYLTAVGMTYLWTLFAQAHILIRAICYQTKTQSTLSLLRPMTTSYLRLKKRMTYQTLKM